MKKLLRFTLALALVAPFLVSCSDDDDKVVVNSAAQIAGVYTGTWTKQIHIEMASGDVSDETQTLSGRLTFAEVSNKIATFTAYGAANGVAEIDNTLNVNVTTVSNGVAYFNELAENGFSTTDSKLDESIKGMRVGGILNNEGTVSCDFNFSIEKKNGRKKDKYFYTYSFSGVKSE
jgi:hypothetical protein